MTSIRQIGGRLFISLITTMILLGLRFMETGLREIRYDHTFETEDELRIGAGFLGLTVGPQKDIKIQLPNYMTKERYDRAYLDLTEQCPGSFGGY